MKKILILLLLQGLFSINNNAQTLDKVNIIIAQDSINELETHPFTNEHVLGDFVSNDDTYTSVEYHYKGAYTLYRQINENKPYRNWKLKVPKTNPYLNRREWNFNYDNSITQYLSYYILKQAGVPCAEPEYVILSINNANPRLYIRYEDMDNKSFLLEKYGTKDGELFKSATDTPNEERFWADFSYLGSNSSDYFMHYSKKMNAVGVADDDYISIRDFTDKISNTPDAEFETMIKANFAWENFIKYLVIGNFISNWDGYPQRPKNNWLYQNDKTGQWSYIPWDLDATFQAGGGGPHIELNMMGPRCSIWFYMDKYEPYQLQPKETKERPLVWRMMKVPYFRNYYATEYKKAMTTYLNPTKMKQVIDSVAAVIKSNMPSNYSMDGSFGSSSTWGSVKYFLAIKAPLVNAELAKINTAVNDVSFDSKIISISPNPARENFTISLNLAAASNITIDLFDLTGRKLKNICQKHIDMGKQIIPVSTDELKAGSYIVSIKMNNDFITKKLMIIK